jgi:hypothetical protein
MWRGKVIQNKFLDTNVLWIIISIVLVIIGISFHYIALYYDLYGNPPDPDIRIDVYTHAVSAIAFVAVLLNFNLGRKRRYYWGIPILLAIIIGVSWEVFEEGVIRLGLIAFYNTFWNAVQDVFMDILGGITAGFFVDEVVE